ncbi:DNA repair protein complementing XP-C cells homolog [Diachasma alloeum]|uniref:DNA repair protein complementing XP-C cells homolog n=1 Tax=Diachasma alloeum TaxID=454923 RepID=UPI0007384870|nr:DNA repair protein complementing XP-C cells homolog [Diachasma alloeum]
MGDDESSDSSDDYLLSPDKIDLDSEFFSQATSKIASNKAPAGYISSNDSSDDDFIEEERKDSSVLLAEVLRHLEETKSSPGVSALPPKAAPSPEKKTKLELADEINHLLAGESGLGSFDTQTDEDDDDKPPEGVSKYTIPKEGIAITLPGTELLFNRRKKRGVDLEAQLIKKMNQRLRSSQLYIHKVGLLCWLAHGFHLNVQVNDSEILSTAMSLVPQTYCPDGRVDLKYLEGFTKWFKKIIRVELTKGDVGVTRETLLERIRKRTAHNHRELVLIYLATLRAIGLNCRLVVALCPPAMKPRRDQLFQVPNRVNDLIEEKEEAKTKVNKESRKKAVQVLKKGQWNSRKKRSGSPSKIVPENSSAGQAAAKDVVKKKAVQVFLSKFSRSPVRKSIGGTDQKSTETEEEILEPSPIVSRLRSKTGGTAKTRAASAEESTKSSSSKDSVKLSSSKESTTSPGSKESKSSSTTSKVKLDLRKVPERSSKKKAEAVASTSDSDSDFSPPKKQKVTAKSSKTSRSRDNVERKPRSESKANSKASTSRKSSIDRRVLSSDEEDQVEKIDARDSRYLWVEVYVESEESWISVSVPDEKIHCVSEIFKKIPRPVLYIIGWNSSGTLKDITRRYCPHWLTDTRKHRVDEKWWKESLAPWAEKDTAMSRAEDEMLLQKELEQPLPKTLAECKGHPLYVVQRHLLKFEALYPPDCVPLGHLKTGDAIYSRHCVHTLRSRETWHKEARVVKPASEAYKVVKSMPKWDKFTGQKLPPEPLELFGQWQTTPYIPPEVKDGIIPRNEYGNVDLFKQCMLPKGAVHIDLPGLNRIARKLKIDCAPACVGFNFGCRGALPAFEGFIVPEEHEDILREAWEEEQVAAAKRAREKRDKRIWGNWRKLIRGLMIRERLAAKYEFKADDDDDGDDEEGGEPSEPSAKRKQRGEKKSLKKVKKT